MSFHQICQFSAQSSLVNFKEVILNGKTCEFFDRSRWVKQHPEDWEIVDVVNVLVWESEVYTLHLIKEALRSRVSLAPLLKPEASGIDPEMVFMPRSKVVNSLKPAIASGIVP